MRKKVKVLFLAADPFRTGAPLRLDEEVRAIDQAIRKGTARDALELVPHFATRAIDLQDALIRHEPQIVHFAGHGDAPGVLYLGDEQGRPHAVGKEALRELFGILKDSVRVVVLNGCDTFPTMEALSEVVDYTIGMNRPISDRSAILFAQSFYSALAMGRTVLSAFELGVSQLEIEGSTEAGTPVQRIRRGVNLDATLVPAAEAASPEEVDVDQKLDLGDVEADLANLIADDRHGPGAVEGRVRQKIRTGSVRAGELNIVGRRTGLEGNTAESLVDRSSPASPREPGGTRRTSEPETETEHASEPVLLGGSAPRRARPGDVILVQFAAYVARFEDQARRALEREAAPGDVRLGEETDCRWAVGARVTVKCTVRGLAVPAATEAFVWDGECRTASFDVEVPEDAEPRDVVIVLEAFVHDAPDAPDAVQVGRLRMALEIGDDTDDEPPRRVQGEAARTAFASYASEDRIDVLERVSSIRRSAGLEVFVDVVSLRMGDRWEQKLREQIASSDRFLLFWSEHAAGKQWVTWEWEQALAAKGEDALELHLLRATPIDTIPERLRGFHFNDVYLLARDAELYRREHTPPAPDT